MDFIRARIEDLEKQISLHRKWLDCMEAVAASDTPFLFDDDIKAMRDALSSKEAEHRDLVFQVSKTQETIARRKDFFRQMVESGMREANAELMESYAKTHQALVHSAEQERQALTAAPP